MVKDLSCDHGLVGSLITVPASPDAWAQYRLTDEQIEFYHHNGYVAGIRLLTDEQVDRLGAQLTAILSGDATAAESLDELDATNGERRAGYEGPDEREAETHREAPPQTRGGAARHPRDTANGGQGPGDAGAEPSDPPAESEDGVAAP